MLLRFGVGASAIVLAGVTPARAERSVADAGMVKVVSGYCSPHAQGTADCRPTALGFSITLGAQTFDSFVVHSNGVLALGEPINYADRSSLLSSFEPPVFSPLLDNRSYYVDGPSSSGGGDDGMLVADYALTADSLTLRWYPCTTNLFCGPRSADASFYDGAGLTRAEIERAQRANWSLMTLTKLGSGFSVTFDYSPRYDYSGGGIVPSTAPVRYGFDLPTASFEADGAAVARTFQFDATGARVEASVPEPATWLTLAAGFGMLGAALRRRTGLAPAPARV